MAHKLTPARIAGVLGGSVVVPAAAVAAALAGVVAAPVAAGVAVVGMTAAGVAAIVGRNPAPAAEPKVDPLVRLDEIEAHIAGKVPAPIQARVHKIATTLRETIPRLDRLAFGSADGYAAVRTATSYLPEALHGYMRLPERFATRHKADGDKTPFNVLCDQLDLLDAKMAEVYVAVCRADADALVAHGRFLAAKFGQGTNQLSVDPQP